MWAYRMFTAEPQAGYMDTLERMMYNVNLAAVSLDGKRFFYENMLRRTREMDFELVCFYMVSEDAVWIGCTALRRAGSSWMGLENF